MYGAIDIGGTKTLLAVFNEDGHIVEERKFPTPQDYSAFLGTLESEYKQLQNTDFRRIVTAAPGLINRKSGTVAAFGNLPWAEVPLEEDTEKIFKCPSKIENDAQLAALSEAVEIGGEFRKVLYVTVSTGIGGGLIINGEIDPDFQDIEPGQMLLEHGEKFEHWEKFASGSAIYKKYGKKASEITDQSTWYVVARNLAIGFNTLIATINPDVIVVGGGVGTHFDKFKDKLVEELKIYENPLTPVPPIRKAKRPEEAVVYGCYEYAKALDGKSTRKA